MAKAESEVSVKSRTQLTVSQRKNTLERHCVLYDDKDKMRAKKRKHAESERAVEHIPFSVMVS